MSTRDTEKVHETKFAVIKSSPHLRQVRPRPSTHAARPYVYASKALGVNARFWLPSMAPVVKGLRSGSPSMVRRRLSVSTSFVR
jgi:hypothetical protein